MKTSKSPPRGGALPPLFDRIVGHPMGMASAQPLLDAEGLRQSIVHELSLMLNTRCTVRRVIYENHLETIPLFGLPNFLGLADFSYFDASNEEDWSKIARFVETAIQAAEPRIDDVHVKVASYDPSSQSVTVDVHAVLKKGYPLKDIHFPLTLASQTSS